MLPFDHPSEEDIELFALNRLPDSESAAIEEHLLLCPRCIEACSEAEHWVRCIREGLKRYDDHAKPGIFAPAVERARTARPWPSARRWLVPAAAVIAFIALNVRHNRTSDESIVVQTVANRQPSSVDQQLTVIPASRQSTTDISMPRPHRVRARRVSKPVDRPKMLSIPGVRLTDREPELMDAPGDIEVAAADPAVVPVDALVGDLPEFVEFKRPSFIRRLLGAIARPFRGPKA